MLKELEFKELTVSGKELADQNKAIKRWDNINEAWNRLDIELEEGKKSKEELREKFCKSMKPYVSYFTKKYVKEINDTFKQNFSMSSECHYWNDGDTWESLLDALNKYDIEETVGARTRFSQYWERNIQLRFSNKIRNIRKEFGATKNAGGGYNYMNIKIISLDDTTRKIDKIIQQISEDRNDGKRMVINTEIKDFSRTLTKTQRAMFGLLLSRRYSDKDVAHFASVSSKTVQRFKEKLPILWENYKNS